MPLWANKQISALADNEIADAKAAIERMETFRDTQIAKAKKSIPDIVNPSFLALKTAVEEEISKRETANAN